MLLCVLWFSFQADVFVCLFLWSEVSCLCAYVEREESACVTYMILNTVAFVRNDEDIHKKIGVVRLQLARRFLGG